MAAISFTYLAADFDMSNVGTTVFIVEDGATTDTTYSFISAVGDWDFTGNGLTSLFGLPSGGVVTSVQFDLGNDNPLAPEISISGLPSLSANAIGIGAGSPVVQNERFWSALLSGGDTFDLSVADPSIDLVIFGDGIEGDSRISGSDDFDAAAALTGRSIIVGDYQNLNGGSSIADGDNFRIAAWMVIGDFHTITSGVGNNRDPFILGDYFRPPALVDNTPGVYYFIGDAAFVNGGELIAGGDRFDFNGIDISGLTTTQIILVGDTLVTTAGVTYGGRDTIEGSAYGELIFGDDASNSFGVVGGRDLLLGNGGDDTIFGGGGDDVILGGAGADYLDGQGGINYLRYIDATGGVRIDLLAGTGEFDIAQGDTLIGFNDVDGTLFNDTLLGDNSDFGNVLFGWDGDDSIEGRGGADFLGGGNGSDTIYGGEGDDTLFGSLLLDDSDQLFGGVGDDFIDGGFGADLLDGGEGYDFLNYNQAIGAIFVNLATNLVGGAGTAGDAISGFEAVSGSFGDDTLIGSSADNFLSGGEGADSLAGGANNDSLSGGDHADTLEGSDGNDTLSGGEGADLLIGGGGKDIALYAPSFAPVRVALWNPALNTNSAAGDTYDGIEIVEGSNYSDTLEGNGSSNELRGGDGADLLSGGFGADTLIGQNGDDLIIGGAGGDDIFGGAGFDLASYGTASSGVTVNLVTPGSNTGDAAGDTLRADVEGIIGSNFADFLQGNSGANELRGGAGNDTLLGGFGDDVLTGGAGGDSINGGDGFDVATYRDAAGAVRVALWSPGTNTGDAAGDIINFQVEVVEGSAFNDNIQGNSSDNNLRGGAGNDLILGGFGNDTLIGGAGADDFGGGDGFDTVSYATSAAAVRVALWNPALHTGDAAGDNIRADIEIVEGSNFNDSLEGSASNNNLRGSGGNDAVLGGGGNDTLWGQAGDDTLTGGAGNDRFVFEAGGGADRIQDMAAGAGLGDVINLTGFGAAFDSFAEVIAAATQSGANVVINFGGGATLTLASVTLANLNADDFVFG